MSRAHELLIRIRSSLDSSTSSSFNRLREGFTNTEKKITDLRNAQAKIKNFEIQIKGFEKIQSQIEKTRQKNNLLTEQISQFTERLSNVSQGSDEYKEIEKAIKALERQQTRLSVSSQRLEMESQSLSNQLREEGISTDRLGDERSRLTNDSRRLQNQIDDLTNSQRRNSNETINQENSFGKLAGSLKGLAVGMAGYFGISEIKQYGEEAIELAKEKIKAETDLQAMLKNTKYLQGDTNAITNASNMLKEYANELEAIGVIGDETVIAGQAQLATFQLMPSTIKKLTTGMTDMLAKNKGMNATQEDAAGLANLFGKVMTGQVGALSKYGVTLSKNQKKVLETGNEMERAAMLAQILAENYGGANEALGQTDEGKMVIMKAEIEGIKEEFGKGLLPIQRKFFEIFKGQGPNISKILQTGLDVASKFFDIFKNNNPEKIFNFISDGALRAVNVISFLTKETSNFISFLTSGSTSSELFKGAIVGLTTAFIAYKSIVLITSTYSKALALAETIKNGVLATGATSVNLMSVAQWAWNTAMTANPIGLIIAGLAGLIAGLVYAYNHSETFRNAVNKLWDNVKKLIEPLKTAAEWVGKLFGGGDKTKNININTKTTTGGTPYTPYTGGFTGNIIPKSKAVPNAKGSVVTGPTYALVGEAGDEEVIIPMNNSPRSKSLLNYANSMIGNKKVISTKGQNTGGDTYIFQVTIPVASETIEKAKQVANATMDTLEQRIEKMKKNQRRLSLG